MSMSTEYVIDRLDEATRVNRDAKQVCNDALSLARGRLASLQNSVEAKDRCIEELEAEVADLKARETVEGNCEILQDSSGNISIKCSSGSGEDRWIPCSERLPETNETVLLQIEGKISPVQYAPRTGYYSNIDNSWRIFIEPDTYLYRLTNHNVIAWQPLPKKYEEPVVKLECGKDVKFEVGDFVVCISDGGNKIHAIYTGEDKDVYWVLDKHTFCPQNISKKYWHLKKCDKYVSAMEWLLTKED